MSFGVDGFGGSSGRGTIVKVREEFREGIVSVIILHKNEE